MKKSIPSLVLGLVLLLLSSSRVLAVTESGPGIFHDFAWFICNPWVSGLLIAIGLSCIIIEIATSGFGIFGVIGLFTFFLYFAGHIMFDRFSWIALILFALGMLFLMLEAFVLTGFGFSGILGIFAIFGAMILLSSSVTAGLISVLVTIVAMTILLVVSFKYMKKKNLIQRFILSDRTDTESGYTSPNIDNEIYIGREGYTLTPLRPAGSVKIDEERVDVVSEGDFVDVGVKVKVIGVDGTRIIVRTIEE
ncbi:MAG: hypothetical protein IIY02_02280 [Firmicutes bacterium]|nr:hypothetical protein [Bacillota bacterium]